MSQLRSKVLHASAAVIANGNSGDVPGILADGTGVVYIDMTAVSGTNPTLDFVMEEKDLVSGKYFPIADEEYVNSPVQVTATGLHRYVLRDFLGGTLRLSWTIGGTATPTFTFSAALMT